MNIGVIGAGIGGLTFAAAMRRFAPAAKVELYERDLSATSRFQGYSLGLKGDGGLLVLKTLGLDDLLTTHAVTIRNFMFCDQRGHVLLELPRTDDEQRLTQRVKRQDLRTALLAAIGDTPIHSDMLTSGFRQTDQAVEVRFQNGQATSVDYLIACDLDNNPIPGFRWAMPVLIVGRTPVATTARQSIPRGVPAKSSAGIRYAVLRAHVIASISRVAATQSAAVPPT